MAKRCNVDISDVVQESSCAKRHHYLTQGIESLPKWYNLPLEEVSQAEQQYLLEREAGWLLRLPTVPAASRFDSNGLLGTVQGVELRKLSAMARQIINHLSIIEIDNLCEVLETECSPDTMRAASHLLIPLYQRTQRSYAKPRAAFDPISLEGNARIELYIKLVDYTTSCVARITMEYVTGDTWYNTNLAVLSQIAMKLKFLARDTSRHAETSLRRAESILMRLRNVDKEDSPTDLSFDEDSSVESYDNTFEDDYIRSSQAQQAFATSALRRALGSLYLGLSPWRNVDLFQISSHIYTVGPEQTTCVIMEDEASVVSATSASPCLKFCLTGLWLVQKNFHSLANPPSPPSLAPFGAEPVTVTMAWQPAGTPTNTTNLKLYCMDELLSLSIPLSLCAPRLGELAEQMISHLSLGTEPDGPPLRRIIPADIVTSIAGCTIQSSGYLTQARKISLTHPNTINIGQSVFDLGRSDFHPEYEKYRKKLEEWTISDSTVTVKCPWYVASVILFCMAVLVAFSVPPGLRDGNPFQYTTHATLVLGMILFAARNRWMATWPWHDFLKGRIVCHSVSEVSAVSGVDAQVVILKLLDHARGSRFVTQGPFNVLFSRADQSAAQDGDPEEEMREQHSVTRMLLSNASRMAPKSQTLTDLAKDAESFPTSFSINKAIESRTLKASGFLILKVAGYNGEHLVCLDARKGETVDFVERNGKSAVLSCLKPPVPRKGEAPTVFLSENWVEWTRMLGVYTGDVVFG
ncbi:hypothetical protein PG985_011370 [Apiospora marii]|uniref:uncharacterized protein n=1 Tax=Apiospora marii TaxID=335849 RepID=UPI003131B399